MEYAKYSQKPLQCDLMAPNQIENTEENEHIKKM